MLLKNIVVLLLLILACANIDKLDNNSIKIVPIKVRDGMQAVGAERSIEFLKADTDGIFYVYNGYNIKHSHRLPNSDSLKVTKILHSSKKRIWQVKHLQDDALWWTGIVEENLL